TAWEDDGRARGTRARQPTKPRVKCASPGGRLPARLAASPRGLEDARRWRSQGKNAMRFTKMQGAGNDYIYVDCFRSPPPRDPAALSRAISDRHFGVGSDGLILICPSE